jgi:hypothetical protein
MSQDHDFGPRVLIFVSQENFEKYYETMNKVLSESLPKYFESLPTSFTEPGVNHDDLFKEYDTVKVHNIQIFTIKEFFQKKLYFNVYDSKQTNLKLK